MYAQVIVDISNDAVDRVFDYIALPDTKIGMRVRVPFGKGGSVSEGYVVGISDNSDVPEDKIKYMYRMLFRLAVTSRIHIIVTISEDKIVNINDDCYTYFDKIINISNYEETNEKITFFRKENDKFVEYLDLVKEL